jgi:Holliday junction DNA helicase RuvA
VGKRTAERIIVELREKVADGQVAVMANGSADPRALARDGLVGLGYDASEAERMLQGAEVPPGANPEELIAAALRASVGGRA